MHRRPIGYILLVVMIGFGCRGAISSAAGPGSGADSDGGGDGSGLTYGTGKLDGGLAFPVVAATESLSDLADGGGVDPSRLTVGISQWAACSGTIDAGSLSIALSIFAQGGGNVTAGVYPVSAQQGGGGGTAVINLMQASTNNAFDTFPATGGSVTLTSVLWPSEVIGSFNAFFDFPDGGAAQVEGIFDAVNTSCGP